MAIPLRVLVVEDREDDAELLLLELIRGGFAPTWKRIENAADLEQSLQEESWDAILSDYSLPSFSAPQALAILRERDPDTPFMVVSGTIGEDIAVEMMRAGANDYLLKASLARLNPALARELQQARNRKARRQAEADRERSEQQYRFLAESIPQLVWMTRADGAVEYLNRRWYEYSGKQAHELAGSNWRQLVHPADWPAALEIWKQALSSGQTFETEYRLRRHDGSYRWYLVSGLPLKNPDGDVERWFGTCTEIHDKKEAALQLQQSQRESAELVALLDTLLNNAPVGFAFLDRDLRYVRINEALAAMHELPVGDHLGRKAAAVVPELWPEQEQYYLSALAGSEPLVNREVSIKSKAQAGQVRHCLANYYPVRIAGEVAGVGVVVSDITLRRRLQEERNQLLERLQLQFERMPIGYVLYDAEFCCSGWNPAAERIFGYRREEVLGQPAHALIAPAHRPQLETIFARLRAGDMRAHSVNENVTRQGITITCEWYNTPLMDADGVFSGVLCMVIDITERIRLQEQYHQAQKMEAVGLLAGGVAHDFNNLLTIINGYSEMLLSSLPPEAPNRGMLEEIRKAGARSTALTRQLLAFSRRQVVNPTVLDLNAIVVEAEKMLRRLLGEDVELLTDLEPRLGTMRADSGQVEQILLNLAVNAREALPQGGKISIRTANVEVPREEIQGKKRGSFPVGWRENGDGFSHHASGRENGDGVLPGSYVMLTLSDTGLGMSAEVKARIWEPFFTTKAPGKGTGLGLAVVHGIVKQWDGHVEVESEPNVGTTFRIYFPRLDQSCGPMKAGCDQEPPPCGCETILLVEDEESVRVLTRTILTACGYSVLEAANGEEALQLVRKQEGHLDLIVTDVVMPGLGGRNLVEKLRATYPNAKVLYLSGYTGDVILRHGILHDEVPFLQKPFTPDALATKVRAVLDPV